MDEGASDTADVSEENAYVDTDELSESAQDDTHTTLHVFRPDFRKVRNPWSAWLLRLLHRNHVVLPKKERRRQAVVNRLMDESRENFDAQEE